MFPSSVVLRIEEDSSRTSLSETYQHAHGDQAHLGAPGVAAVADLAEVLVLEPPAHSAGVVVLSPEPEIERRLVDAGARARRDSGPSQGVADAARSAGERSFRGRAKGADSTEQVEVHRRREGGESACRDSGHLVVDRGGPRRSAVVVVRELP